MDEISTSVERPNIRRRTKDNPKEMNIQSAKCRKHSKGRDI